MKTKTLLIVAALIAACNYIIPEPLIEKARIICEPYGGLKEVWNNGTSNGSKRIDFRCENGDQHTIIELQQPEKQP